MTDDTITPIFVSEREAALRLGIAKNTLRSHVADGTLPPPRRLGRRNLHSMPELLKTLEATRAIKEAA